MECHESLLHRITCYTKYVKFQDKTDENLRICKRFSARKLLKEFSNKLKRIRKGNTERLSAEVTNKQFCTAGCRRRRSFMLLVVRRDTVRAK